MGLNPISQVAGNAGGDLVMRQFFAVLADVTNVEHTLDRIAEARDAANEVITKANAELAAVKETAAGVQLESSARAMATKLAEKKAQEMLALAGVNAEKAATALAAVEAKASDLAAKTAELLQSQAVVDRLDVRLTAQLVEARAAREGSVRAAADAKAAEARWAAKLRTLQQHIVAATSD